MEAINTATTVSYITNDEEIESVIKNGENALEEADKILNIGHMIGNYMQAEAQFKLETVIRELKRMKEAGYEHASIEIGDDAPMKVTAEKNDGETTLTVAPMYREIDYREIEKNLLGYVVSCDTCGWKDRYKSKHKAFSAANDHEWFNPDHSCDITDSEGEEVERNEH